MPPAPGAPSRPPTVVLFSANPSSLSPLDLEGERQAIETELAGLGLGTTLRLLSRPAATPDELQRVLLAEQPAVVQLSAHGRRSRRSGADALRAAKTRELAPPTSSPRLPAGIMLHGTGHRDVQVVSGAALADLFARAAPHVRLVFLNACHSAEQAEALLRQVGFVVAVDGAILDEAARVFAVALYRALAYGRSIQVAFDLAVNALMLHGLESEVALPVLRVRPGADPRKVALVASPEGLGTSTWDVFVSYTHADREAASELARALHERELLVYFDEWERQVGDVDALRLGDAVDESHHGLLMASTTSLRDPWILEQYAKMLKKAVEERRRLIPVIIGEGEVRLPGFLANRAPVDLRGKAGADYQREIQRIADAIRGRKPGPPPRQR